MDNFDYNLRRMTEVITPYNVSLRPHAKMHKSIDVARQQLAHGRAPAAYAVRKYQRRKCLRAGIPDILITNQVCDQLKIKRLVGIANWGVGCLYA